MSSGQKAVAEDEDDWEDLKQKAEIAWCSFKLYSPGAHYAAEGFAKYALKGQNLIEYVTLKLEIQSLIERQRKNDSDYEKYLELKRKYEKS